MEDLTSGASNAPSESISTPEVETSAPASTAREAIERAFQSVNGEEAKPSTVERARDEAGRFAPKQADKPAEVAPVAQDGQQQTQAPETPATVAPPPQRFAKFAQEAWAQAPETVRAEVIRMEAELTKGLNEYQQRWEPLKQFDEMAKAGGTTLDQALSAYVNMENLLRSDPVRGLVEICHNAGIDPAQVGQILAGQQPTGGASPEVAALKAEIANLKQELQGVGQTISQRDTLAQVEAFAKDKPRFDELSETIAEMLSTGFAKNLQDAYEKAERLNPAPAPAVTIPTAAPKTPDPAQTQKKASLSITGSPASGSNPGSRKPAGSPREALENALAQMGLR